MCNQCKFAERKPENLKWSFIMGLLFYGPFGGSKYNLYFNMCLNESIWYYVNYKRKKNMFKNFILLREIKKLRMVHGA